MTAARFAAERARDWRELESLLAANPRKGAERRRLGALYRAALADLGLLRTLLARDAATTPPDVLPWLNALVARAHAQIAMHRRASAYDVPAFFLRVFPRAFRAASLRIGFAAFLVLGSALAAYLLCRGDVGLARTLAGPAMARNAEHFGKMGDGRGEAEDAVAAAFYVTNNTQVAFISFALGLTFGVGTLWVLIQNGIAVGVTLALVQHFGVEDNFYGFVASHAGIELAAIFIAAGAGLGMGRALVAPGPHSRLVALKHAGRDAAILVTGAACLLFLAALFEGFVSPSSLPISTRVAIGALNVAWLGLYLGFAGRGKVPG